MSDVEKKVESQVQETSQKDEQSKVADKSTIKVSARSISKDAVITIVTKENPRRKASKTYQAYELYKDGDTVAAFLEKGGRLIDLKADIERGHVSIK